MKPFHIRKFSGIETKYEASDQDRGTLRKAIGVGVVPMGALSGMPTWATAWGLSTLGAQIESALGAADPTKVHIVIVNRGNWRLLVAWDMAAHVARGCAFKQTVNAAGDPGFSASGGVTITATNSSVFRDKTAGLQWYASHIGGRIYFGNGTDTNLKYDGTTLSFLGPSVTPSDLTDPSREAIPPCTAFHLGADGRVYAGGNVSNKLRVWFTEPATSIFPTPEGVLSLDRSYRDILSARENATITAISAVGQAIVCHLGSRGAVELNDVDGANDGFKARQVAIELFTGALNQACAVDIKSGPFYLGADFEVYRPRIIRGVGQELRDRDLATDRSPSKWNTDVDKTSAGAQAFVIYDEKNGRLWMSAPLSAGSRNAFYCYNEQAFAVTGPFLYPDLTCAAQMVDNLVSGFQVVGISRDGALLYADLSAVGEPTPPAWATSLGASYAELSSAPVATPGLPYVGVSADGTKFKQVLNGQVLSLTTPWGDLGNTDFTATKFYDKASLAVFEIDEEDFGVPELIKEFCQARLQVDHNTRFYFGVFAESEGRQSGKWRGSQYPREELIAGLTLSGRRLRIRVIVVYFNDQQFLLRGMSVDFLTANAN